MSNSLPMKVWSGTEWVNIGVQSGQVLYQNEEPSSPQTGSIWIDSDDETVVLNDQDFLTINSASAIYAPSASPTFSGQVNLPATTNYDGNLLSATLGSKLDLAGGKILQIVRATDATIRSTTSSTFVDVTGMSVTITPQKSDSAVLILATFYATARGAVDESNGEFRLADASGNAISGGETARFGRTRLTSSGSFGQIYAPLVMVARSTPATTSATTYKLMFRVDGGTMFVENSNMTGQMYAIEVSA